jgi:hypothetical protein
MALIKRTNNTHARYTIFRMGNNNQTALKDN